MTQGTMVINGARLWYEDTGSGPVVTLIHAGVADNRMWDEQVPALAAKYRVIRYDMRGFGQSELPAGPFSLVEDLKSLLDALGVERTAVMGCSMGGAAAIDFALTYPERVGALILVGPGLSGAEPVLGPSEETLIKELEAAEQAGDLERQNELELRLWVDGAQRTTDEVNPAVRERMRVMNGNNLRRAPEWEQVKPVSIDPPAARRLGEMTAPTLLIVGSGDTTAVRANVDALAAGVAGARKVVMDRLGHVPNMDEPQEFNHIILDFLTPIW